MRTIKATEAFRLPGTDIIVAEGSTLQVQEAKLDELKHAKKDLEFLLKQTIPSRVMLDVSPEVEFHAASLWKPRIIFDGNIIWFAKTKENGIMLNPKVVKSINDKNGTMIILTTTGLKYTILH